MKKALLYALMLVCLCAAAFAQTPAPPAAPEGAAPPVPPGAPVRPAAMTAPCVLPSFNVLQPRMMDMLSRRLELTDAEKPKVEDLLKKSEEAIIPLVQEQQKAAQAFAAALTGENVTQAELQAAGDRVMKAETAVLNARIKTLFDLRAILTPEQNKQLNEMLSRYTSVWRTGPGGPGSPGAPGAPGDRRQPSEGRPPAQ